MYILFLSMNQEQIMEELNYLLHIKKIILNDVSFDRESLIADLDYQIMECRKALEKEQLFMKELEKENTFRLSMKQKY